MAEEKSNYTMIVAGCSIVVIALILVLKDREMDHLTQAGAGTTLEGNATALAGVQRYRNVAVE